MSKRLPKMRSNRSAEQLLARDLSAYLNADNFKAMTFEFAPKDKSVTLRLNGELLELLKKTAKRRGIQYQRLIREAIEEYFRVRAA